MKTLVFGYGNIDRQDDGVAWHVLLDVMHRFDLDTGALEDEDLPVSTGEVEFQYHLQLMPEMADQLGVYDKVVFIDAHTGNVPEEVHVEVVSPQYQSSPFTHHMTASTLLSLCYVIHQKHPRALLVSVRGHEFQFTRALSVRTNNLVPLAGKQIEEWIKQA